MGCYFTKTIPIVLNKFLDIKGVYFCLRNIGKLHGLLGYMNVFNLISNGSTPILQMAAQTRIFMKASNNRRTSSLNERYLGYYYSAHRIFSNFD